MNGNMMGLQALAVLTAILGVFSTVFWMVLGLRAVRAHETLAENVEYVATVLREKRN